MSDWLKNGDIVLLAGYRQHGKDTFYRHLAGHENTYVYDVRQGTTAVEFPSATYKRVAFADTLKEGCARYLGMSLQDIEELKDSPLPSGVQYYFNGPPSDGKTFTVRDVLIDYGRRKRAENIDYFVDLVIDKIMANTDCITVVTDFRFINEFNRLHQFFEGSERRVVTARLFRFGAPFPPATEESEHQLDSFNFQIEIRPMGMAA